MGLLDSLFDQNTYGGQGGGLLDFLRTTQMQNQQYQPSAGFGAPPMDANAQAPQAAPMAIGDYQMPRIGPQAAFTPEQSNIPPNAQPTQGQTPQAPQPPQEVGFGDRMLAGINNFANARGPLQAIAGGITGLATGTTPGNQTAQFLASKFGIDPAMAKQIASDPVALREAWSKMMGGGGQTDDIKEYQFRKKEEPSLTFGQFMQEKRSTSGKYGMQGYWGTKNGKPALLQLGKDGVPVEVQIPEGFDLARDPVKVDGPTGTTLLDPQTRQPVGFIPKDVAGAARAAVTGKGLGEADVDLASIKSKMPGLETVVKQLDGLSEKATYTMAGKAVDFANRQAGMEPRPAAIARAEYTSMVDNQILPLLRDTFGAAFTQKEGDTLRATLGDPDKSPKEKQAILKSFIEQKRRDIEALEKRTGQGGQATAAPDRAAIEAELRRRGKIK